MIFINTTFSKSLNDLSDANALEFSKLTFVTQLISVMKMCDEGRNVVIQLQDLDTTHKLISILSELPFQIKWVVRKDGGVLMPFESSFRSFVNIDNAITVGELYSIVSDSDTTAVSTLADHDGADPSDDPHEVTELEGDNAI